jgi:hypothetical protein
MTDDAILTVDSFEGCATALTSEKDRVFQAHGRWARGWVEAATGHVPSAEELRFSIVRYVYANRGVDSEDIARHFAIDDWGASEIVQELLRDGLLAFDE